MGEGYLDELVILVLAALLGFELISRVPSLLHTPLMSATNAIHGVVLVGAMAIVLGPGTVLGTILGLVAVVLATVNVVGGFVVTGRMLEMFRSRRPPGGGR